MTEVRFYHLTRKTLEQALPELLEKTVALDKKAVVIAGSAERAEALTQFLWTYRADRFLPHGNAKDGHAEDQPVWITDKDERPNEAEFLFLTDGATSERLGEYVRACDLFDGNDAEALRAARKRWSAAKKEGHTLSYWQQTDTGWIDATPKE